MGMAISLKGGTSWIMTGLSKGHLKCHRGGSRSLLLSGGWSHLPGSLIGEI